MINSPSYVQNDRLYKVMGYIDRIHDLCKVLNCDFLATIREVHPSLENSCGNEAKSISDETIERLSFTVQILREEKSRRMQQVRITMAYLCSLVGNNIPPLTYCPHGHIGSRPWSFFA